MVKAQIVQSPRVAGDHDGPRPAQHLLHRRHRGAGGDHGQAPHPAPGHRRGGPGHRGHAQDDLPRVRERGGGWGVVLQKVASKGS